MRFFDAVGVLCSAVLCCAVLCCRSCPSCNNICFAFRNECNRCQTPKPAGGGGRAGGRDERYGVVDVDVRVPLLLLLLLLMFDVAVGVDVAVDVAVDAAVRNG